MADISSVAIGGALGIVGTAIGQFISGRRQNQQWLFENRKQEYRELLSAFANAVHLLLLTRPVPFGAVAATDLATAEDAKSAAFRIIQDRIFIADRIDSAKIKEQWTEMCFYLKNGEPERFLFRYEELRRVMLAIALDDLGIKG